MPPLYPAWWTDVTQPPARSSPASSSLTPQRRFLPEGPRNCEGGRRCWQWRKWAISGCGELRGTWRQFSSWLASHSFTQQTCPECHHNPGMVLRAAMQWWKSEAPGIRLENQTISIKIAESDHDNYSTRKIKKVKLQCREDRGYV